MYNNLLIFVAKCINIRNFKHRRGLQMMDGQITKRESAKLPSGFEPNCQTKMKKIAKKDVLFAEVRGINSG